MRTFLIIIGVGALLGLLTCAGLLVGGVAWVSTLPDGGVLIGDQVDDYAMAYLKDNALLEPGETVGLTTTRPS